MKFEIISDIIIIADFLFHCFLYFEDSILGKRGASLMAELKGHYIIIPYVTFLNVTILKLIKILKIRTNPERNNPKTF